MTTKQSLEKIHLKLDSLLAEITKVSEKFDKLKVCPNTESICLSSVKIETPIPPVVVLLPTSNLYVGNITKSNVMTQVVDLGVAGNGGVYKVVVFDDKKMRVYVSAVGGYKQITDATKASIGLYLTGPFIAPRIQDILWNVIGPKLFPEEIK